jgi:hypothetical protein
MAPKALLAKYKLTAYIDRIYWHSDRLQKIFLGGASKTHLQLNEFLLQDPALPPQAPAQLKSQTFLLTLDQYTLKKWLLLSKTDGIQEINERLM